MTESTKSRRIVTATNNLAEAQPVKEPKILHSWGCGEAGHSKNDPNCPKKKKTQPLGKLKQKMEPVKAGDNSKKRQFKCNHCGDTNHDVDHYFQLYPEMRPASYIIGKSPRKQSLEAKVAELEQKLKSSASFAKISELHAGGSTSGADMYMFGASGEVVAAASTRSQTLANAVASTSGGSDEVSHPRHAGPADQVGQARLPLSFGLVDTTVVGAKNPVPLRDGDSISKDVTQALAYRILHMPIFMSSELMAPDFKPAGVFHLAGRMLEGKADLPSLQVSQVVVDVPVAEEVENLTNLRASLADVAIIAFGKHTDIPP
jgi:hypothetical protein